jgi:hypothetical protein
MLHVGMAAAALLLCAALLFVDQAHDGILCASAKSVLQMTLARARAEAEAEAADEPAGPAAGVDGAAALALSPLSAARYYGSVEAAGGKGRGTPLAGISFAGARGDADDDEEDEDEEGGGGGAGRYALVGPEHDLRGDGSDESAGGDGSALLLAPLPSGITPRTAAALTPKTSSRLRADYVRRVTALYTHKAHF